MRKILKNKQGITLVALVVTIIVLLILAGVTITSLLGDDGIIAKAQQAADATNTAVQSEQDKMNTLFGDINNIIDGMASDGSKEIVAETHYSDGAEEHIETYATLEEALENTHDGYIVVLVKNYELKEDITIPSNVTLENNAYTLTCNKNITLDGTIKLGITVNTSDGKARSVSDITRGRINLGSNGKITVNSGGLYIDKSLVSDADIQVTDYINYPYSYTNVETPNPTDSSETSTSIYNGWRVATNYTNDDGNKIVKITTAGVPEVVTVTEDDFTTDNLDGPYNYKIDDTEGTGYELKNLWQYGEKYYLKDYATSYSVLGLHDGYQIVQGIGCENELVLNEGYYFVNAYVPSYGIIYASPSKISNYTATGGITGIRPVIVLKNDIHVYQLWDDTNSRYYWEFVD